MTFRFQHKDVKMAAAEQEFEAGGHKFGAGAFVIADANRAALEPSIKELGLSAWAVDAAPTVPMHDLDVPRIGYVHTWTSTQDEGWVRHGVRQLQGSLHLLRRHRSCGRATSSRSTTSSCSRTPVRAAPPSITGGVQGNEPRPVQEDATTTPNVGTVDTTDDMRGSIGVEGLHGAVRSSCRRAAC